MKNKYLYSNIIYEYKFYIEVEGDARPFGVFVFSFGVGELATCKGASISNGKSLDFFLLFKIYNLIMCKGNYALYLNTNADESKHVVFHK